MNFPKIDDFFVNNTPFSLGMNRQIHRRFFVHFAYRDWNGWNIRGNSTYF